MKVELLVRFANDGTYYNKINVDPSKIKDPMIFPNEVFFYIDNVRVATKRDNWDQIQKNLLEK
jgi:hypothetical protein